MTFYIGKKKNVNCSVILNLTLISWTNLCCSKKKCRPKLILLRLEIRNNTEMYVVCVLEEMTNNNTFNLHLCYTAEEQIDKKPACCLLPQVMLVIGQPNRQEHTGTQLQKALVKLLSHKIKSVGINFVDAESL